MRKNLNHNVELRGAINDEIGAYNGCTFYVNDKAEVLASDEYEDDPPAGVSIEAKWAEFTKDDEPDWTYRTEIPHSTFLIHDGDDLYCRGIVFSMDDVRKMLEGGEVENGSGI